MPDGTTRQAVGLVARRGEDTTILLGGPRRGGPLLRRLQRGENLGMPHARPMSSIGRRCYELRIVDAARTWRIVYRLDADAIVIADVFPKTTRATPRRVIDECQRRLSAYDRASEGD